MSSFRLEYLLSIESPTDEQCAEIDTLLNNHDENPSNENDSLDEFSSNMISSNIVSLNNTPLSNLLSNVNPSNVYIHDVTIDSDISASELPQMIQIIAERLRHYTSNIEEINLIRTNYMNALRHFRVPFDENDTITNLKEIFDNFINERIRTNTLTVEMRGVKDFMDLSVDYIRRQFNGPDMESVIVSLPKEIIDTFPIVKYDANKYCNKTTCSVCLVDFCDEPDNLMLISCEHLFHEQCIKKWFEQSVKCPMCNKDMRDAVKIADDDDDGENGATVADDGGK